MTDAGVSSRNKLGLALWSGFYFALIFFYYYFTYLVYLLKNLKLTIVNPADNIIMIAMISGVLVNVFFLFEFLVYTFCIYFFMGPYGWPPQFFFEQVTQQTLKQ